MTKWWPSSAPSLPPHRSVIPPPSPRPPLLHYPYHQQRRRWQLHFALSDALPPNDHDDMNTTSTRRRVVSIALLHISFLVLPVPTAVAVEDGNQDDGSLELYMDKIEGFTVLHPSSWLKVEKAGATVLFEDVKEKANSLGIVVSPVKLSSLRDFGTPQFVAEKLIQAERRKESTKDAQIITALEILRHEGLLPVYEFEYTLDSTRGGMKRIFSAAFVISRKLYLLNITHSDNSDKPLDGKTKTILEQMLHSFDIKQL